MDQQTDKKSKTMKLLEGLGESIYMRSPILGQAIEGTSIFRSPQEGETRMSNIIGSIQQTAVQNSPMLRQFSMFTDFIRSALADEDPNRGNSQPSTLPGQQPLAMPAKAAEGVYPLVEYLDKSDNPYRKLMERSTTQLEKIVDLLKAQQSLMIETQRIQNEANERLRTSTELSGVDRNATPKDPILAAIQDMQRMGASSEEKDDGTPGDFIGDIFSFIKENFAAIASSLGTIIGGIGTYKGVKGLKSVLTGMKNRITGKSNPVKPTPIKPPPAANLDTAPKPPANIDGPPKPPTAPKPPKAKVAPKFSLNPKPGLLKAARPFLKTTAKLVGMGVGGFLGGGSTLGAGAIPGAIAGAIIMDQMIPDEIAQDPSQILDQYIRDKLRESGVSALPEIRDILALEEVKPLLPNINPEYLKLLEDNKEAWDYAREQFNNAPSGTRKQPSTSMNYSDTNPIFDRKIKDYTKSGDSILTPDALKYKLEQDRERLNSINENFKGFSKSSSYVDTIMRNAERSSSRSQPSATMIQQPPAILNQGGPTNINNGGNVTNIITGHTSLDLPQISFNLPSMIS